MLEKYSISDVRRDLKIDNAKIAAMFGYSSKKAFENSSAKKRIEAGIVDIYTRTKEVGPNE